MAFRNYPELKTPKLIWEDFNNYTQQYEKSDDPFWTPLATDPDEFFTVDDSSLSPAYGTEIDPNTTVVVNKPPREILKNRFELSDNPNVAIMEQMSLAADERQLETLTNLRAFSVSTKMVVTQENGQRSAGPPEDYDGQPPPKGCEVFIGHLHRDVTEPQLYDAFSIIGYVYQIRLMLDFSGNNRGYCFVKYFNPFDAQKAVTRMDNYEIMRNYRIGVMMSVDDCRILVSGLPKSKSRQQILREMKRVTDGVSDVIVHEPLEQNAKHRGYAYVDYVTHKHSAMARRRLIHGTVTVFNERVLVEWAQAEPEKPTLMVREITSDTSDLDLRRLFNVYGSRGVTRVKRSVTDWSMAFIDFLTKEQADASRLALNGHDFKGSKIEVKWGRPRHEDGSTYAHSRKKRMARQSESEFWFHNQLQMPQVATALHVPLTIMDTYFQQSNQWQQYLGHIYHQNWQQLDPLYSYSPVPPVEWSRNTMDSSFDQYYQNFPTDSAIQEPGPSRMSYQREISPPRMDIPLEELAPGAGRPRPTLQPKAQADFEIGFWNGPEAE